MASQVTLKALGLNYSPNNLALPEGSLLVANDVIVRRDNVVESRRGFKDYSEPLGLTTEPVKQLIEYKERIIAHYLTKIAYDTLEQNEAGQNVFADFAGNYSETQNGLRIKSIVASKNLYFTTSEGIKKISAKTADDFPNTQIVNSGAVKALDLTANLDIVQGQLVGFLPVDSAVAYRVIWGYKDANENLIYGTPSERTLVYNYLQDIIPLDFNTLLTSVDNLNQTVAISTVSIGNPTTITTATNHSLSTGDIVTISGTSTTNSTVGAFEVTVTGLNTFQINVDVTVPGSGGTLTKSLINDGNYYDTYKLTLTDSGDTFKNNVLNFAEKLDKDILYADLNATPVNAPLTIDSLQVNIGSIGQINFNSDEDPTLFFEENGYVQIEGFESVPVSSSVSLTNVGGAVAVENPVTITTNPNTLVNGREVNITGATTVQSVNGVYTATVDERTIVSTSGGGTLPTTTVISGIHAQQNISAFTANDQRDITAILQGSGSSDYTTTNITQVIYASSFSATLIFGVYPYVITTPTPHGLSNGDVVYLDNFVPSTLGNPTPSSGNYTVSAVTSNSFLIGVNAPSATAGTCTTKTKIVDLTLTTNHALSSGDQVNIDSSNLTYGSGSSVNGTWTVNSTTVTGTTSLKLNLSGFLDALPPSPDYGTIQTCLKVSLSAAISNGTLVKVIGLSSTPSLYTTNEIDNSISLYYRVPGGGSSSSGYFSYTVSGPLVVVYNATIPTAAKVITATQITTSSAHSFVSGKLIELSGITTASVLNGNYIMYDASGSTFKILPNISNSVLTGSGVAKECTQFQTTLPHGLSVGDAVYVQATPPSTFVSTPTVSGKYYVHAITSDTFYISLTENLPIDLVTTTSVTNNTPVLFKRMVINTSDPHGFIQNNWITISNSIVPEGINGPWQIEKINSLTQFTILPTSSTSYTPTSGIDVGQVNRITIPVMVSSVTNGTGTVKSTVGKDLTIFNGNYLITSVVAPAGSEKGYIQFLLPNNPDTFTAAYPDVIKDANAKIYSYDYRNIVNSPDINYAITLNDLEMSPIPTSEQLRIIQNNIERIGNKLRNENAGIIQPELVQEYLQDYSITIAGNVKLEITIPEGLNSEYFYQVYRTRLFTAEGIQTLGSLGDVPVTPDDEMRLVYESFPTQQEMDNLEVTFIDEYPEDLALTNENLYTNPLTGQGILQANDTPPFAKDVNVFKNSVFFANTKTKQRITPFQLIGTSNISGTNNKITIGDSESSITYLFNPGVQQVVSVSVSGTATQIKSAIQNNYFTLNTPVNAYYVWFKYDGQGVDPLVSNKKPITVNLNTGDGSSVVINKIISAVGSTALDFVVNNNLTISGIVSASPNTTISTVGNHGLLAGDTVVLSGITQIGGTSLNGTFTIVSVPTTSSFTIATASTATSINFTNSTVVTPNCAKIINIDEGICDPNTSTITSYLTTTVTQNGDGQDATINVRDISLITSASSYTTIQTASNHGLSNGDSVVITGVYQTSGTILNGTHAVSSVSFNTFQIPTPTLPVGVNDTYGKVTIKKVFPKVLLAQLDSRSQSIDITARSLVQTINKQPSSPVYAFYISNEDSSPGVINLEAKNLTNPEFYVIGSGDGIGSSFTPDISPEQTITSISAFSGNQYLITSNNHGLRNDDTIIISGSDCTPNIDGVYSVQKQSNNQFTVTASSPLTVAGTIGVFTKTQNATVSTNEEKANRVYYSKTSQPEAVPILNYFDVGSSDKEILRLMPIRDSLFVFKEDGLYRISGEEIPFVVSLFDSSCIVSAPDSVSISNNIIYAWTVKGISNISESGVAEISRPIDTEILKLASNRYPNFKTATWGVGYDSDNSYTVFTNSEPADEFATIGFRYSDLTNTWTNVNRSQNCGLIFSLNDKMYSAGGSDNIIYQERKNFDRTDYADSDFHLTITNGNITNIPNQLIGTRIYFQQPLNNVSAGDIITQTQILTHYTFNTLLEKLDIDPTVGVKNIVSSSGSGEIFKISVISPSSPMTTVTTSVNHGLSNGDKVVISGINQTAGTVLNNSFTISSVTLNSFEISTPTNPSGINILNGIVTVPVTITTSGNHNLNDGDYVTISNTNSTPSIDGVYKIFDKTAAAFDIIANNVIITQATSGKVKRNYALTLKANNGDSLRNKMLDLASYLDTDPGLAFTDYLAKISNYSRSIVSNSEDNPTIVSTLIPHNLVDGRIISVTEVVVGVDNGSIPSLKNKTYPVSNVGTFGTSTTFTIPVDVTTGGGLGLQLETSSTDLTVLDVKACYNAIIDNLNSDVGATFKNYKEVQDESLLEAVILGVNYINKFIDVNLPLSWTDGEITIYKSIPCELVYAPITFGDPLSLKQIFEATMMFDNKAFTKATASFNTDLKPEFLSVDFYGQGNGIFGHYSDPGFGYGFFGGLSNSAPFRTILPRQSQRCRFLTVKFEHSIGRERWALNGITLTGNVGLSSRGYR